MVALKGWALVGNTFYKGDYTIDVDNGFRFVSHKGEILYTDDEFTIQDMIDTVEFFREQDNDVINYRKFEKALNKILGKRDEIT